MILLIMLLSFSMQAAQTPSKDAQKRCVVSQIEEVEQIYKSYLAMGMSPDTAAKAALQWQDVHYPVLLYPTAPKDCKSDDFKKGAPKKEDPKKKEKDGE